MRCEGCGVELRSVRGQVGGAADLKRPPVGMNPYVCENEICDRFGLTVQRDSAAESNKEPSAKSWRRWRALRS